MTEKHIAMGLVSPITQPTLWKMETSIEAATVKFFKYDWSFKENYNGDEPG